MTSEKKQRKAKMKQQIGQIDLALGTIGTISQNITVRSADTPSQSTEERLKNMEEEILCLAGTLAALQSTLLHLIAIQGLPQQENMIERLMITIKQTKATKDSPAEKKVSSSFIETLRNVAGLLGQMLHRLLQG